MGEETPKPKGSVRHPFGEICIVIADLTARALETYKDGNGLSIKALEYPPSAQLFERAAKSFENSGSRLLQIADLADAASLIASSFRHHCVGEIHYFRGEYTAAHNSFRNASRELDLCIENHEVLIEQTCSFHTPRIMKAYRHLYEIESLEALAFQAMGAKDWEQAQSLHQEDIALTKQALALVRDLEVPIRRRLEGHIWFARRGLFECLAHISADQGDIKSKEHYMRLAREANEKSLRANPLYQSHEDARNEVVEWMKSMPSGDEDSHATLDTTWIANQDFLDLLGDQEGTDDDNG